MKAWQYKGFFKKALKRDFEYEPYKDYYSKELYEFPGCECIASKCKDPRFKGFAFATPSVVENNWYFRIADLDRTKSMRISMTSPKYIYRNDNVEHNWILTDEEKIALIEYLNVPDSIMITMTTWKSLIYYYNVQLDFYAPKLKRIPMDLPMPDYTKLP